MKLREFIIENRNELQTCINRVLDNPLTKKVSKSEIRLWILNDEGLYRWAKREGVKL